VSSGCGFRTQSEIFAPLGCGFAQKPEKALSFVADFPRFNSKESMPRVGINPGAGRSLPLKERGERALTQIRKECTMKHPSFFGWYRILRGRYHLSVIEAMRSALWLVH
jgi:hypothetical protein